MKSGNLQANNPRKGEIRIRFVDTDVAEVLQALGVRTKDNIVYAGQGKKPITINVNASTTEEALRYITAAAGLAFRQAGNSYVVAPASALKQAIEPLGEQARVPLTSLTPAVAIKVVEDAFPYVTARPAGSQVLLIGAAADLRQAQGPAARARFAADTRPLTNRSGRCSKCQSYPGRQRAEKPVPRTQNRGDWRRGQTGWLHWPGRTTHTDRTGQAIADVH